MSDDDDLLRDELGAAESVSDAVAAVRAALARLGGRDCDVIFKRIAACEERGVALPVVGHHGWFATVVCTTDDALTPLGWQRLALVAASFSIWCVEHGVNGDPWDRTLLTPRQYAIAFLAARGRSNAEIADALAISINTVKARLKQTFARLGVDNRIELGEVLRAGFAAAAFPPRS